MAREIEARLRLSAIDRTKKAFDSVAHNLDRIDRKSRAVERAQRSMGRAEIMQGRIARAEAAFMARAGGVLAPAAIGYAGAKAYKQFAGVERELTRIGQKAGASRDQMRMVRNEIEQIGHKWAVPIADVTETFDTLIESGFEFDQARKQLSDMVKVTQALGGAGADTVQTWDAIRKNLGASPDEFMAFFDAIAAGGAAGKFEASDIAQYLPILAPSAAKMGINSLEEFQELIGVLEALRDVSGDSSQTVTSMSDFLEKLTSPAVVKAFKGADIDIYEELDKAEESGEDLWNTMHRLMMAATGGDARRLGEFFGDKEARRMATLLLTDLDRVLASIEKVKAAGRGTIDINVNAVLGDSQAKIDRLSNSIDALITEGGAALATWLNDPLEGAGNALARGNAYEAGLERLAQEGGTKSAARADFDKRYGEANPDFDWWDPLDHQERSKTFVRGMQAYGRGEIENPQDYILKHLAERAREGEETILKASDLLSDPNGALGFSTGRIATPSGRPDLGFSTGAIATPSWRPDPSAPSVVRPEGSISALPLEYPRSAPEIPMDPAEGRLLLDSLTDRAVRMQESFRVDRAAGSGPVPVTIENMDHGLQLPAEPEWTGWRDPNAPISIPDYSADGSSGWRGGAFDEGRLGDGELAVQGIEELRQAMSDGETSLRAGGDSVGQSILSAAQALERAAASIGTNGREAAAAISGARVRVDVPSSGATRPAARSMPDAGVAGEQ